MPQDTSLQQDHLYEIAFQAQKKAIRAHRRKMKRNAAKATLHQSACLETNSTATYKRTGVSSRQRRGTRGEDKAAQYLQKQGLLILARNIHCRAGEIDLIATDRKSLIFVEVRLRVSSEYGGAAASVNRRKQRRLIHTAQFFLPQFCARYFGGTLPSCRFDVISIDGQHLHWIKHAFDHTAC